MLSKVSTAADIYRRDGAKQLASRATSFLQRRLQGGTSSRRWLQPVAGVFRPVYNFVFQMKYGSGVDVMAEEWDNLIILDAARYDDFEELNHIPGVLESRISAGADSQQFVRENFSGAELHDTVYVTANPHIEYFEDDIFHAVVDDPIHDWDSELECVRPGAVTDAALEAHERFPDKRLIIHYMQPHDPPIGPTGDEIRAEYDISGALASGTTTGVRLMTAVAEGDIPVETARRAYRENLEIVLDKVDDLVDQLDGKSIVTADHGEMFGEEPYPVLGNLYEHYQHPRTVELCKVPWLIVGNCGERRTVQADDPVEWTQASDELIEEQLEALGYR